MPTFKPKTEAELPKREFPVWPKGEYEFEIYKAEDKTSAAGNEYTKLHLRVFNKNTDEIKVWDNLMYSDDWIFKVRHCCDTIGILEKYENGDVVSGDYETGTGRLKLGIQEEKDGYARKNIVLDYVKRGEKSEETTPKKKVEKPSAVLDDSIPFALFVSFASLMMF